MDFSEIYIIAFSNRLCLMPVFWQFSISSSNGRFPIVINYSPLSDLCRTEWSWKPFKHRENRNENIHGEWILDGYFWSWTLIQCTGRSLFFLSQESSKSLWLTDAPVYLWHAMRHGGNTPVSRTTKDAAWWNDITYFSWVTIHSVTCSTDGFIEKTVLSPP